MYTHSFNQIYKAVCALILFYKSQLLRNLAHKSLITAPTVSREWMKKHSLVCV